MPNSYFQFKEFTVHQQKSAMKVCTDACLFGAWAANIIERKKLAPRYILDIGTGTGLLSLMLAQKTKAHIDAVEVDDAASYEAQQNVVQSKWLDRIQVFKTSIQNFIAPHSYDIIISNPPFYVNSLKSPQENKNSAKHTLLLTYKELLLSVETFLNNDGKFFILLPYKEFEYFAGLSNESKLFLHHRLDIRQTPQHNYFRTAAVFGKQQQESEINEIIIKDKDGGYTHQFTAQLKDYYLYL